LYAKQYQIAKREHKDTFIIRNPDINIVFSRESSATVIKSLRSLIPIFKILGIFTDHSIVVSYVFKI